MFARAIEAKDVQAFNSLRDTAGEKPSDKLDASITAITPEEIEEYGLKEGTTLLEAVNLAQVRRAMKGDTKAAEYVRDTLGEKPSEKVDANITAITPADEELIKRVAARLPENGNS